MTFDETAVVQRIDRLSLRELRIWVREGWVRPAEGDAGPVFDDVDLARARLICDLRKDMALGHDALAVVLGLIDRLHQTREDLRCLADALGEQPEEVRRAVTRGFVARRSGPGEGM